MKHHATVAALCALLFLSNVSETSGQKAVQVIGIGRVSCGVWLEVRAKRDSAMDVRFTQFREWIGGYLTAYNVHIHANGNVSAPTDSEGMYAWLDNYCQKNPTVSVMQSVEQLIRHLDSR
jgi:hypothetical protein